METICWWPDVAYCALSAVGFALMSVSLVKMMFRCMLVIAGKQVKGSPTPFLLLVLGYFLWSWFGLYW
jgi:hypothetical protein